MPNPLTSLSHLKRSAWSGAGDRPVTADWISFMRSVPSGPILGNKVEARPCHSVLSYDPRDIEWGSKNQGFPGGPITRGCLWSCSMQKQIPVASGLLPRQSGRPHRPEPTVGGAGTGAASRKAVAVGLARGWSDPVKAGLNLCGDAPTAGNALRWAKRTPVSRRLRTAHDRCSGAAPSSVIPRSAINLLGNGGCPTS
jgi:hypothetical protein